MTASKWTRGKKHKNPLMIMRATNLLKWLYFCQLVNGACKPLKNGLGNLFFINCLLSYSDYEKGNLFSSSSWWVEWSCIPGICSGYFPWLFHIEQWSCVTGWEHMIPVSGVNTGVIPRLSWSPLLQDSVLCQDYAKLLWSSGGNLAARLTVRWYQEVNCNSSTDSLTLKQVPLHRTLSRNLSSF